MYSAVIGSKGFIGSALMRYANTYHKEEWVGINRQNYTECTGTPYDTLIWVAGAASKRLDRRKLAEDHILGLSLAMRDFEYRTFVYVSSQAVYEKCCGKAREDFPVRVNQLESDYAWVKYMGEKLVRSTRERWIVVRPNGFTGPGLAKNVVYDLASNPPKLFVSWDSEIQYMHVDKFAEIMIERVAHGVSNYILNCTSKDYVTPADVAGILGVDLKSVKIPTDKVVPSLYANMDVTRIEQLLNIQMPSCREAVLNWNRPLY